MIKKRDVLIILGIVLVGFVFLRSGTGKKGVILEKRSGDMLSDFEDKDVWDISPERGFSLKLSRKNVTEGKHSLEVVFPKDDMPSINTRKLKHKWGNYEYFAFDVYNPQKEPLSFTIRLDDESKQRTNIEQTLEHGWNKIRVPRPVIAQKIDAAEVSYVVLFLNGPEKKYRLYFDNMRLERSGLIEGVENIKPTDAVKVMKNKDAEPLPVRAAVLLPAKPVQTKGEVQLILTKIKEIPDNRPLLSSGIPFAPGQLKSEKDFVITRKDGTEVPIAARVLARWPEDGSVRSVLVQFRYPIEHIYEYVQLKWGVQRTKSDLAVEDPVWDYPEGLVLLSPEWLCASGVLGEQLPMGKMEFKAYDDKVIEGFTNIQGTAWTGELSNDGYYSTPHVFYQLYVRSGELKYFLAARKELLHYRDTQIVQEGPDRGSSTAGGKSRYIYVEALADDYFLTGDPRSLRVAGYMAEFMKKKFPPEGAYYPKKSKKFWTERDMAFPFLGALMYYQMSGDKEYLKFAGQYMENLYKTQLEWPARGGFIHNLYAHDPDEGARPNEYGGSPFMTGLLLEPIIEYHRLTGNEKAADSIFRAVDWLINEGLGAGGKAFIYMTADKYASSSGEADLNPLAVQAFGYAYRLSGYRERRYLDAGQTVFDYAVEKAFTGKRKHFNQSYRSSAHYLAYVWDAVNKSKPLAQTENPGAASSALDTVLFFEGFDRSAGMFAGGPDAKIIMDTQNVYLNGNSLNVKSSYEGSGLKVSLSLEGWNMEDHPYVSFVYRIPMGVPVGLRVATPSGEWLCLGGSTANICEGYPLERVVQLIDDGSWHEVSIDVRAAVQQKLSGIKMLKAFEFTTRNNAKKDDQFWIDEFKVRR